ncbi:MAG: hypothetical protein IPM93_19960 [Candidatus Obscuribacter sp.]|nr:hypothetical protein [Candidatus Obscuribacter sp.]
MKENNRPVDYLGRKKEIDEHVETFHMLAFPVTTNGNRTQASLSAAAAGAAVCAVSVAESALAQAWFRRAVSVLAAARPAPIGAAFDGQVWSTAPKRPGRSLATTAA